MNWTQCLNRALGYIEAHLTDAISIDEVASQSYAASSHFQLVFHLVMGITVGEYIRNRRLTQAALELQQPGAKVSDVARRYRYDTPEGFSKAFTRFHGAPPSKARLEELRLYQPLTIHVTVKGGFAMSRELIDDFLLLDPSSLEGMGAGEAANQAAGPAAAQAAETYRRLASWARQARGVNPGVFDALTGWLQDDANWTEDTLADNEWILMQGVLARFQEQNATLRALLQELEPAGVVNPAAFTALDRFDQELSGHPQDEAIRDAVAKVFADFSTILDPQVRALIAGEKAGPTGTDHIALFGYVNYLSNSDAAVQWALFMPGLVEQQLDGFRLEGFEYRRLPAMRFVGFEGEEYGDVGRRLAMMKVLDALPEQRSGFDHDLLLKHHYGVTVDVGPWHGVWGRFLKAGAPVPEGFIALDFTPEAGPEAGPPYLPQFAEARFAGDMQAMHSREGFDDDAMYDITRNIILGEGVNIPYPGKYWTAEVFYDGCDNWSTGCLFAVEL